jgi:putative tryptophan/tyrosine transport system substrate-binding protein
MRRRDFVKGIASSTAWPLAARAQQARGMRRIIVLTGFVESDPEAQRRVAAFLEGLKKLGWINGQNVSIDYRWARAMPIAFALTSLSW